MTNDFINNSNSSDSSIFKAHIGAQDLSQQEKINEYKAAAEELFRKDFRRRQEIEDQAYGHVDEVLSNVDLRAVEEEDYFTDGIDSLLAKLFKFFNFMDSELEMEADPQVYSVIKEKKEKDLLAAVIKFLHDKLKELVRKVFSKDLSLGEKIDKEIKELRAKLDGGGLPEEEFARVLERLEALQNLKLKIQMFLVGWVISAIAQMLEVELTALVETGTSKEEDKKAEPKEKEATKEVREDVEIKAKVDEREVPKIIAPISLFDFSSGFAKPIPLTKPEFDLLREPIKKIVIDSPLKVVINEVPKQEVKENKQAKQEAPKVAMRPPEVPGQVPGTGGITFNFKGKEESTGRSRSFNRSDSANEKDTTSNNRHDTISNFNREESKSTNERKTDDPFAKLRDKVAQKKARGEKSATDAQPTGECRNVKVNNHVNSMEKAPEQTSSRGY